MPPRVDETIHVCYALYDRTGTYSRLTGTSMCSVFAQTRARVVVHLLHDNTLTAENRARFIELVRSFGQQIAFYNMEELLPDFFVSFRELAGDSVFSPATLYRLLAMKILSPEVKKLIYLDSDTVLHLNVQELWQEDTGPEGLAAVPDQKIVAGHRKLMPIEEEGVVDTSVYFNAGILLIDMEKYRAHPQLALDGLKWLKQHPNYFCFDQDILNVAFRGYRELPTRYNICVAAEYYLFHHQELRSGIYHYSGSMDVNFSDPKNVYAALFLHYFRRTPWATDDALLALFQQAAGQTSEKFLLFWQVTRYRLLVWMGAEENVDLARAMLPVRKGDAYLTIHRRESRQLPPALIQLMKEKKQKGEMPLFAYVGDRFYYHEVIEPGLKAAGFSEHEDFCYANWLLDIFTKKIYPVDEKIFLRRG